jgi:hypothetical protein
MNRFQSKRTDETRQAVIEFSSRLSSDELLLGTLTVSEVTSSDLTISDIHISSEDITYDYRAITSQRAVTFLVSGGVAGKEYTIRATVATDAGQTLVGTITFRVN